MMRVNIHARHDADPVNPSSLAASQLLEVMRVNIHARHDADPVNPSSKLSVFENLKSDMERALASGRPSTSRLVASRST